MYWHYTYRYVYAEIHIEAWTLGTRVLSQQHGCWRKLCCSTTGHRPALGAAEPKGLAAAIQAVLSPRDHPSHWTEASMENVLQALESCSSGMYTVSLLSAGHCSCTGAGQAARGAAESCWVERGLGLSCWVMLSQVKMLLIFYVKHMWPLMISSEPLPCRSEVEASVIGDTFPIGPDINQELKMRGDTHGFELNSLCKNRV